jgi:hypothetical protein
MHFNVPFLPDEGYIRFLKAHRRRLAVCHFSLYTPGVADARVRLRKLPLDRLIANLQRLQGPEKLLLLNARFNHPQQLQDKEGLRPLLVNLSRLLDAGVLDGIVCGDFYLVAALAGASPQITGELQAVPGINFMIDTPARVEVVMEALDATPFKTPSHLALDRSLNRAREPRVQLLAYLRKHYPDVRPELLANEGCLPHCLFKPSHDAYIALANCCTPVDTHELNRSYGCLKMVSDNPSMMLRSPFIRPEDTAACGDLHTIIKLCGRTLGPGPLRRILDAYFTGRYDGNLLELLDTLNPMSAVWHLPNRSFDPAVVAHLDTCDKRCRHCSFCRELFRKTARRRALCLPAFEQGNDGWRKGLS